MKNIFLADDDDDDRLIFKEAIKELKLNVKLHIASDGEELLSKLENSKEQPDIIIVDLNMPKKSGFECLADIRDSEKFRNIPVVILSTSYSADAIEIAFQLGADRYLSKPNSFDLFKNVIKKVLLLDSESRKPLSKKDFILKPDEVIS